MDYAMEFALMSDLYDTMTGANDYQDAMEGLASYVGTRKTALGKIGAAVKYIFAKILQVLGHILTFIPRAIITLIRKAKTKGSDPSLIGKNAIMDSKAKHVGKMVGSDIDRAIKGVLSKAKKVDAYITAKPGAEASRSINSAIDAIERYDEELDNSMENAKNELNKIYKAEDEDLGSMVVAGIMDTCQSTMEAYLVKIRDIKARVEAVQKDYDTPDEIYPADEAPRYLLKFVQALEKFGTKFVGINKIFADT